MRVGEILRDFALAISFLAGVVLYGIYPSATTLISFISALMIGIGIVMLVSPGKSPKILGGYGLLVMFMERKKHKKWSELLIRFVGLSAIIVSIEIMFFVYNRILKLTSSTNLIIIFLFTIFVLSFVENYIMHSYRKKLKV